MPSRLVVSNHTGGRLLAFKSERKREHYYCLAKKIGYRSRAAFKLIQLNERYNILRRGDVVVDLGAAPGGWLQVAAEKIGEEGFVLGVDLQPIKPLKFPNVRTIVADILDSTTPERILKEIPRKADVVLSDASPRITGVWSVDHARSAELVLSVLKICQKILSPGGRALVKVFQGEQFPEILKEFRKNFDFVKVSKPIASRKQSAESYIIGKGFRAEIE